MGREQLDQSRTRDNRLQAESPLNTPRGPEPFVSSEEAAQFLAITRRHLLVLARNGIAGAYALGTGTKRRVWVFRLSELTEAIAVKKQPAPITGRTDIQSSLAVPAEKRKQWLISEDH
jgi:hypothetical protein